MDEKKLDFRRRFGRVFDRMNADTETAPHAQNQTFAPATNTDARFPERPNIYLLGFMGTGKTSVGKRLAQTLGYTFIDSDEEIEKKCSMEIKDIFAKYGEDYFRKLEREFIDGGHPASNCVISCGGGLVCRDGMPELVKSKGIAIVLFSRPDEILERIGKNDKRPLLNVENPLEKIRELLDARMPYYRRSGVMIATDKDLHKTVDHILRIYKRNTAESRQRRPKKSATAFQPPRAKK